MQIALGPTVKSFVLLTAGLNKLYTCMYEYQLSQRVLYIYIY